MSMTKQDKTRLLKLPDYIAVGLEEKVSDAIASHKKEDLDEIRKIVTHYEKQGYNMDLYKLFEQRVEVLYRQ